MKYDEIRSQIRSGDLLAWTHKPWKSWYDIKVQIVRLFQRSEYSHVGTAYVMGGRVWVIEAVIPHPRIIPLSNAIPFYWIPLNAPWKSETEINALSLIGKDENVYSNMEAFEGAIKKLIPGEDKKWMCSELSWVIAKWDGIDLGDLITPSGLVERALSMGNPLYLIEE